MNQKVLLFHLRDSWVIIQNWTVKLKNRVSQDNEKDLRAISSGSYYISGQDSPRKTENI